jgi:hypothetical protein
MPPIDGLWVVLGPGHDVRGADWDQLIAARAAIRAAAAGAGQAPDPVVDAEVALDPLADRAALARGVRTLGKAAVSAGHDTKYPAFGRVARQIRAGRA